eukprot:gene7276-19152_t
MFAGLGRPAGATTRQAAPPHAAGGRQSRSTNGDSVRSQSPIGAATQGRGRGKAALGDQQLQQKAAQPGVCAYIEAKLESTIPQQELPDELCALLQRLGLDSQGRARCADALVRKGFADVAPPDIFARIVDLGAASLIDAGFLDVTDEDVLADLADFGTANLVKMGVPPTDALRITTAARRSQKDCVEDDSRQAGGGRQEPLLPGGRGVPAALPQLRLRRRELEIELRDKQGLLQVHAATQLPTTLAAMESQQNKVDCLRKEVAALERDLSTLDERIGTGMGEERGGAATDNSAADDDECPVTVTLVRGAGGGPRDWGLILDKRTLVLDDLAVDSVGESNAQLCACVGMTLKKVGGLEVSTGQEYVNAVAEGGGPMNDHLELGFGSSDGSAVVLLVRRGVGMTWGLVLDNVTMQLNRCKAGSVAASSARTQRCIGKVLAKVNGMSVRSLNEFGPLIAGLDAIGLRGWMCPLIQGI